MESKTIRPILGLKSDVPHNDPSLFAGDSCHCVEMQNIDLTRLRNTSRKAFGKTQYSDTATSQATRCQGLYELKSGSTTDHLYWDNGKFYYLNSSLDLTNVDASSPVTFSQADGKYFSVISVGGYAVMTDSAATLTPYKWKNGDANLTKLIQTGTEYKFRYLAPFQRRIIGAYSDQTDGDIEIRWTQPWTESNYFASACTMAAANQLFKPGDDSITGIKTFGSNACFLYGENSIDSIDYYQNYATPFAIRNMVSGHGCTGHHSIIDAGGVHYLFNKNYGFVAYRGGAEFPYGIPISYEIEDKVAGINATYYDRIIGAYNPTTKECVWAVPLNSEAIPNTILKYNIITKQWHLKNEDLRYIDFWTLDSTVTWNDLADLGYSTWDDISTLRWSDIAASNPYLSFGNTDGHVYTENGETDNGAAFDAYRVEPILSLGETHRSLLLEVWFGLASVGNYNIYVYYRSGDTEAECENASWNALTEVSANSPDNAVTYIPNEFAVVNRYHQIKWGTDGATEPFAVNSITFKYIPQGEY